MNADYVNQVQQQEDGRRARRKFKTRTCAIFYEEMSDFEFLRTFRFTKDGVRHLTALLGKNLFFILIPIIKSVFVSFSHKYESPKKSECFWSHIVDYYLIEEFDF